MFIKLLGISYCFTDKKTATEKLNTLPKITQLVSVRAGVSHPGSLADVSAFSYCTILPQLGWGWGTSWCPQPLTCLLGSEMLEMGFLSWRISDFPEFLKAALVLFCCSQEKQPRGNQDRSETKSGTDPLTV